MLEQKGSIMKKTILEMMCGIIAMGLLSGCANVQEEFESAVHRDDLGAAEKWLARGATVNPKGKWGFGDFSLLDDVTYFGHHEEMVYWLLEHGATAGNGVVPWEAIAMMGNQELLRIRLEKGANVNEKDDEDKLRVENFWANWKGNEKGFIKAMQYLHEYGVKIHDFNYRMTPLQYAASKGWLDAVKYLLKQGADVKDKNSRGASAIHFAKDPQTVQFFLDQGVKINCKDDEGDTPLHYAIKRSNDLNMIKFLLDHGANVNSKNSAGRTPFHHATAITHSLEVNMDVIKILLDHGADINSKDRKGNTPLHYVCSEFPFDYCVPDNPKVHATFYRGCFCKKCQLERLEYLISRGANVNAQNEMGQTALHLAVIEFAGDAVIEYLTKHGADLNLRDRNGKTVLDLVQEIHNERFERLQKAYQRQED